MTLHDKIEMRKDDKIDDSGGLEYKETPTVRWSTPVVFDRDDRNDKNDRKSRNKRK